MKKWHAEASGDCDVHRDIYEEGNPKPIAERVMFDAANALVAAHNGEQEGAVAQRIEQLQAALQMFIDMQNAWLKGETNLVNFERLKRVFEELLAPSPAELVDTTPPPQGQSRSETGAAESDEQIAREVADKLERQVDACASMRWEEHHGDKHEAVRQLLQMGILSAITRANKARDEQSAPAAEQFRVTDGKRHGDCESRRHGHTVLWMMEASRTHEIPTLGVKQRDRMKLNQSSVWRGQYLGLHFKITHWGEGSIFEPHGTWNYYVYLPERLIKDFEQLWLPPKVIKTTPESHGFVSYDYGRLNLADADWHGGCTYYAKHGEVQGHRVVEMGCDYAHLFDRERGYPYDVGFVEQECRHTIERLAELLNLSPDSPSQHATGVSLPKSVQSGGKS